MQQKASSVVDGLMSGTTFVYIAIVFGVVAIVGVILKVVFMNRTPPPPMQFPMQIPM